MQQTKADYRFPPDDEPFCYRLAAEMARKVPVSMVSSFRVNFASVVQELSNGVPGEIDVADGCSGSGVFSFFVDAACLASHRVFDVPRVKKLRHRMMAELDTKKQKFLLRHHDVDLLVANICDLKNQTVTDIRKPTVPVVPPSTAIYCAGYSCQDRFVGGLCW